jgi:hypothetical protein
VELSRGARGPPLREGDVVGYSFLVKDGMVIKAGTATATWDPLTRPIITEYAGTIRFENVEKGVTVARQAEADDLLDAEIRI